MKQKRVDAIIIGAGLSGIGVACHFKRSFPNKTFLILESRSALGGTWDLFKYPGIRSDSDMFTLGYNFKPWTNPKAIADGASILSYIQETAKENDIEEKIFYDHKVVAAAWSSPKSTWTVTSEYEGANVEYDCQYLIACSGYYDYEKGFTPVFKDVEKFEGTLVHPQHWPEDLDYENKKVVVIGSGATAVTLIPSLAEKASHITMLQRSPTYIAERPSRDKIANGLRRILPSKLAYFLARWKSIAYTTFMYQIARRKPELVKAEIKKQLASKVGSDIDIDKHFTPKYDPWDQRLCLSPDGDFFDVLRSGKASVVTDNIQALTQKGIQLSSGELLEADIIITATGLNLKVFGGMQIKADGVAIDLSKSMSYKGVFLTQLPNFAGIIGYTNASWTLKSDLTANYLCRVIKHIDKNNYASFKVENNDPSVKEMPFLDLTSGYVSRSLNELPKQGSKSPWRLYQNYTMDLIKLKFEKIDNDEITFLKS